jgi:hypothetical protein
MNFEEALRVVNAVVSAKEGRNLSDAEETVLQGAWDGKTYEQMAETSSYAVNYLKNDAGPNFWKLLSTALGEKVSKANFRAVLEGRSRSSYGAASNIQLQQVLQLQESISQPEVEAAHSRASNSVDWGKAPDVRVFYGRQKELDDLQKGILEKNYRLVALVGMRGIGKTTLTVKLVERLKTMFDYVIWRSLDDDPPPPLENLLADIIKFLSNQQKINLPGDVDDKISLLIEYLRSSRCLLVLDNAESLMQVGYRAGHYQEGYEKYGELFKRVGTERHQSCLLLTTRENPEEIVELEAKALAVRSWTIQGLKEVDARQIFESKGLSDEEYWGELINVFERNPLALQIVSARIQSVFGGKVSEFLKQKTITQRTTVDLLEQQFNCLSNLEKEILRWLAIEGQPISFSDLKESTGISGSELLNILESLRRRALIQGEAFFTLEPVVKRYIDNKFAKEKFPLEVNQNRDNIRKLLLE